MWIASKLGFFSVVKKAPNFYHVRGRSKRDIENIIEAADLFLQVEEDQVADYRYRVIVTEKEYQRVMTALMETVDYRNFKDMIHDNPDQKDKYSYYSKIWGEMFDYQRDTEPPIDWEKYYDQIVKDTDTPDTDRVDDGIERGSSYLDRKWNSLSFKEATARDYLGYSEEYLDENREWDKYEEDFTEREE